MQRSPQSGSEWDLSQVTFCLRMPASEDVSSGCPVLVGSASALGSWQLGESLVGERYEDLWSVEVPITEDSMNFFFSWVLVDTDGHARLGRYGHHKVHLEHNQAEVWSVWGTPHTRLQYIKEAKDGFVRFVLQYHDTHDLVPAVIGSIQPLGNWSLDRVVKADPLTHIWIAQAEVPPESSVFYNWVLLDAEGRCKGRDLGELRYLQVGLSDLQVEVAWGQAEQTVRWASLPQFPSLKRLRVKAVFPSAAPPGPPPLAAFATRLPSRTAKRTSILKRPSVVMEEVEEEETEKEQLNIEGKKKEEEAEEDGEDTSPHGIFARLTGGFRPHCEGSKERALSIKAKEEAGSSSKLPEKSEASLTSYDGIHAMPNADSDQHKIVMNSDELKTLFDSFLHDAAPYDYPIVSSSSQQLVLDPEYLRITYGTLREGSSLSMMSDQGSYGRWESMLEVDDFAFTNSLRITGESSRSRSTPPTSQPPSPPKKAMTPLQLPPPPLQLPPPPSREQAQPDLMMEISMESIDAADTASEMKPEHSKAEKSAKKKWSWSRILRKITAESSDSARNPQCKNDVNGDEVDGKKKDVAMVEEKSEAFSRIQTTRDRR